MDVQETSQALYAGPPGDFVERRDALVREARDAGDRDLASALAALRRPTVAAWLANLLVREHRDQVEQLLDLGAALREAQDDLDPDQLRALGRQRRQVVNALVTQARRRAAELGQRVGNGAADELDATLTAALADPEAATAVLSGTLTAGLQYAGLGFASDATPSAPPARTAAKKPAAAPGPKPAKEVKEAERAARAHAERVDAAERALAEARLQAAHARATADAAAAEHEEAERSSQEATELVERLTADLDAAKAEVKSAGARLAETRKAHHAAEREAVTEERRAERAATALDDLRNV